MKKYLLLFLFLSFVFLFHYWFSGKAVYGDGIDYWAYLHTWVIDGNLDFTNEYKHIYTHEFNNSPIEYPLPQIVKTAVTRLGKTDNIHPIGTSLVLLPWYLLSHVFAQFTVPNGYSDIYQLVCGLGVIFYITLASFFSFKLCFHHTKNYQSSVLASFSIVFCTQLFFYAGWDNLNSHFASYFLSSLFWLLLFTLDYSKLKSVIISVAIVSLAALVRVQDGLLIIPLLLVIPKYSWKVITLFLAAVLFSPQLFVWIYLYGQPLPKTYMSDHLYWDFFGSIFHPINGLIRTPINLLAAAGIPYLKKSGIIFASFLIPTYLLISLQGGWKAAAYGGRMYISVLPIVAVLLAHLFSRWKYKFALSLVVVLAVINIVSMTIFVVYEKETSSPHKRGLEPSTLLRIQNKLQ